MGVGGASCVGLWGVHGSGPVPLCAASCQRPAERRAAMGRRRERESGFRQKVTGQRKKPERICVCEKILQAINKNVAPRHMPHKIHSAATEAAVATMEESRD